MTAIVIAILEFIAALVYLISCLLFIALPARARNDILGKSTLQRERRNGLSLTK